MFGIVRYWYSCHSLGKAFFEQLADVKVEMCALISPRGISRNTGVSIATLYPLYPPGSYRHTFSELPDVKGHVCWC